jgi:hypothetical protein
MAAAGEPSRPGRVPAVGVIESSIGSNAGRWISEILDAPTPHERF